MPLLARYRNGSHLGSHLAVDVSHCCGVLPLQALPVDLYGGYGCNTFTPYSHQQEARVVVNAVNLPVSSTIIPDVIPGLT
jgi:hypothetical protein